MWGITLYMCTRRYFLLLAFVVKSEDLKPLGLLLQQQFPRSSGDLYSVDSVHKDIAAQSLACGWGNNRTTDASYMQSARLDCRVSWVRIPPRAPLLLVFEKKELSWV